MLSWPSARASCLFSGCFVLISQDLTIGEAGRGLRGSLRKESADRSHQRAARSLAGWRCWENGGLLDADVFVTAFIAVASSGRGVGLERGDASHTGGVPAAGDTQGSKVRTCCHPGSAGRSPASPFGACEGQRHMEQLGWLQGWAASGWWSRALLRTSSDPGLAGAVPGDTPVFQCQP